MSKTPTKTVSLAYGKGRLDVEVPVEALVIEPRYVPGVLHERAALVAALRAPIGSAGLRALVRPGQRVAIASSSSATV